MPTTPLPSLSGDLDPAESRQQAEAHWREVWMEAALPDADRSAWRDAMAYRTKNPADAERLAALGLRPQDVIAARTDTRVYWLRKIGVESLTTAQMAALADETARFHDHYREIALARRGEHVQALASHRDAGWTYDRIGALIGVTKQRARMIARNGSRVPHKR